jgi:hypothetical protein
MMESREHFNAQQLAAARRAKALAAGLVTDYYRIAPREWDHMRYEVKTLRSLESSEIVDTALAQTLCYSFRREAGPVVLAEGEIYRICLQDHRILNFAHQGNLQLKPLLTYVLTHELVHVVRFGQRLQEVDLPTEQRVCEERSVDSTTGRILAGAGYRNIAGFFSPQRIEAN